MTEQNEVKDIVDALTRVWCVMFTVYLDDSGRRCDVVPLQAADLLAWSHFQNAQQEFIAKPASRIAVDTMQELAAFDDGTWLECLIVRKQYLKEAIVNKRAAVLLTKYKKR